MDHKSIVKPTDRNSPSYIVFKKFILRKSTINQYKNNASRDLDDWKRVERNHTYRYVTDEKRSKNLSALVEGINKKSSAVM